MARKFDIIKKKNLPDEASIIGFSFLKEPSEKDKKNNKFDFCEHSNNNEIGCMRPKRKSILAYTRGYVSVDGKENAFVEAKSRFLIIILMFALLIGSFFVPWDGQNPPILDLPVIGDIIISDNRTNNTTPTDPDKNTVPTITFAGYGKFTVSSENPYIEVSNPSQNFVDMVFTIKDEKSGEIIARTAKVSAGQYAYVDVVSFYVVPGTYTVCIETSTFDAATGAQMNGMNQKMEVIVIS